MAGSAIDTINGETDLEKLLKTMKPVQHTGDYVFCAVPDLKGLNIAETVLVFREEEATTVIVTKEIADKLGLKYSFIAAWITLTVHSSLQAVGLTAAFSAALAQEGISCNVVAAFYHDHIFVDKAHVAKAIEVLNRVAE